MHVKNWCVKDLLLCVAVAFGVSACGGVGDGNQPETFDVLAVGSSVGDSEANAYLCVPQQLSLRVEFTNGDVADYVRRAVWTSSNTDVLEVSNGDIAIPGVLDSNGDPVYYAIGTVLPHQNGSARVTADYLGVKTSLTLRVQDIKNLQISPANRIAPGSFQTYEITGVANGVVTNVSAAGVYSFAEPDDDIATVSEFSPVVTGVGSGGPLTLLVRFPLCDREISAPVTVAQAQALVLQHESGFSGQLIRDTTESFSAWADFGDGPEQDLSAQSTFGSSDTDIASFASARRILLGNAAGTADVTASFGTADSDPDDDVTPPQPLLTSNSLSVKVVNATLNSIRITPRDITIRSGTSQQFKAEGSYNDGARTQDITRHVVWSVTDTDIARIGTGVNATAGLLASIRFAPGTVDVQAEQEDATDKSTDKTTVTFDPDAPVP